MEEQLITAVTGAQFPSIEERPMIDSCLKKMSQPSVAGRAIETDRRQHKATSENDEASKLEKLRLVMRQLILADRNLEPLTPRCDIPLQ